MIKQLLNEHTASEMTGLKVSTLRKRRWQGLPPRFLKVGSKVFYEYDDLQNFLKDCRVSSTTYSEKNIENIKCEDEYCFEIFSKDLPEIFSNNFYRMLQLSLHPGKHKFYLTIKRFRDYTGE